MTVKATDLGKALPFLAEAIEPRDLAFLGEVLRPVAVRAGERVLHHGRHTDTLYLIARGTLCALLECAGETVRLGERRPGQWVGEIGLIEPGPASADVDAETDADLWVLSQEGFERVRRERPAVAAALLEMLSRDVAERLRTCTAVRFARAVDGRLVLHHAEVPHEGFLEHLKGILGLGEAR